jgi:hypothetical protein
MTYAEVESENLTQCKNFKIYKKVQMISTKGKRNRQQKIGQSPLK